jgi:hypothetical protein
MDYTNIQKALQEKYSTNISSILIPSRKRTYDFRSINVGEQKTLTKIMLDADGDQYVIYQAFLGLIQATCLDDDLDIKTLTELDRIKILIELYNGNFFDSDIDVKCQSCEATSNIKIDYASIIKKLESIDLTPKNETIDGVKFTIAYPNVVRMGKYYKTLSGKKTSMSDMYDIYDQFISVIEFNGEVVKLDELDVRDVGELLCIFPQEILYGDDGIVDSISTKMFNVLDNLTEEYKCSSCGDTLTGGVSIQDFFT